LAPTPHPTLSPKGRGLLASSLADLLDHCLAHDEFFSGDRHGEVGDEADLAGDFALGGLAAAEVTDLFLREGFAVAEEQVLDAAAGSRCVERRGRRI